MITTGEVVMASGTVFQTDTSLHGQEEASQMAGVSQVEERAVVRQENARTLLRTGQETVEELVGTSAAKSVGAKVNIVMPEETSAPAAEEVILGHWGSLGNVTESAMSEESSESVAVTPVHASPENGGVARESGVLRLDQEQKSAVDGMPPLVDGGALGASQGTPVRSLAQSASREEASAAQGVQVVNSFDDEEGPGGTGSLGMNVLLRFKSGADMSALDAVHAAASVHTGKAVRNLGSLGGNEADGMIIDPQDFMNNAIPATEESPATAANAWASVAFEENFAFLPMGTDKNIADNSLLNLTDVGTLQEDCATYGRRCG